MRRAIIISLFVAVPLAVFAWWVARNTYWAETDVPMPLKGEALRNPHYAAQRFADALGARTAWDRVLTTPSADAIIVLSGWHWNLSTGRRQRLERWVESGGRLVVDMTLVGDDTNFESWSGIAHRHSEEKEEKEEEDVEADTAQEPANPCRSVQEAFGNASSGASDSRQYWLCHVEGGSFLTTRAAAEWTLRDDAGIQAMRVQVGRGSVTAINAAPFRYLNLFDGDNGAVFVSATQLRKGDAIHFLSEETHPSLLALVWRHGRPVLVLALPLLALALWRGAARFGPLEAGPHSARRSLAEQIRGTGHFTWRHGGGDSLHAACVRALDEAAQRRIPRYSRLSGRERAEAVARLTGFDWHALAAAVHHPDSRRSPELRGTIGLLEAARRLLITHPKASHGRD